MGKKTFGCKNVESQYSKVVPLDVFVEREEVFIYGRKAAWDERKLENGVIWFMQDLWWSRGSGRSKSWVELSNFGENEMGARESGMGSVEMRKKWGLRGVWNWREFGYVLVVRFVLKGMDGNIVVAYDFKHTHQIRCKWEWGINFLLNFFLVIWW